MKKLFPRSLKVRIMIAFLCAGILPALILVGIILYNYRERMNQTEISRLSSQAKLLSTDISSGTYFEDNGENETINAKLTSVADAYAGRIMVMDASLKVVQDTYDMYEGRIFLWENVVKASLGEESSYYDTENSCLIITAPIEIKSEDESRVAGVILMAEDTGSIEGNLEFLSYLSIVIMLAIILAAIVGSLIFSQLAVKPFYDIRDAVADMERNGGKSINAGNTKEAGMVSDSFNKYFEQMQTLDDTRQEFVSNVSHELKTPLTSMKVLADSINSMGDGAPIEMYREFMGDITNEIDRETKIINDLLSLVRMDKSKADLNISVINVNELLELLLKRLEPLAAKQEVDLVLETFRPVTAEVDEVKFTLAIMNLIENGIKYNNSGGWVHVSVNSDHQYCYIRVEDNGLGIPEEDLEHIFDRFFRADKSHSREISGTGLGLAITWDAIVLHHGEIKVNSILGEGTTFDVRIPLSYIKEEDE